MGLYPRQPDYAWYRHVAGGSDDRVTTGAGLSERPRQRHRHRLSALALCAAGLVGPAHADDILRIAVYAAPLSRDGPGLLLRDIGRGDNEQIDAVVAVIDHVAPDVLVLTDIDYDLGHTAVAAFSGQLAAPFDYIFARAPNAGRQMGLDLSGDGYLGDAEDGLGYGRFFGDGGIAVLSHLPILDDLAQDLTGTLWRDVPGATLPMVDGAPYLTPEAEAVLPVSSTAHWAVPVQAAGGVVTVLAFDATAPIFDGPEDKNGLRNRDELRLWEAYLDGAFGPPPALPVLAGNANIDPVDGQGLKDAINRVLARPDLQDPRPTSPGAVGAADADHKGDPSFDTADWPDGDPGNLRVSYVLPSADVMVVDAGVVWPAPDRAESDSLRSQVEAAGAHRLVWVDVILP